MNDWIEATEHQPEPEEGEVTLVTDGFQITLAFLSKGEWKQVGTWNGLPSVTHWMPLPDLPEAE